MKRTFQIDKAGALRDSLRVSASVITEDPTQAERGNSRAVPSPLLYRPSVNSMYTPEGSVKNAVAIPRFGAFL